MKSDPATRTIRLHRGALISICNAKGRTVTVVRGAVWITQENDTRDVVLEKCGTFTFDRDGVALAHVLGTRAILAVEEGISIERVKQPSASALPAIPDVSPGSPAYRHAHELRAQALEQILRTLATWLRCFGRNLMHRTGLPVQPC
jgi:hypothetical protein